MGEFPVVAEAATGSGPPRIAPYHAGMEKTRFGKTGLQVSRLTFGAGEIGYLNTGRDRAARILNLLLDAGVNVIDTASSYKEAETVIGEAVGHRRDEYVLVSKCGQALPEEPSLNEDRWSAAVIEATVDRSLRRLRTDRLDVMLLHTCDLATLQKGEAIAALVQAKQAGKVRFVGYSGDNEAAAYAASHPDIAVLETSISIADQANLDTVLPEARAADVGVMVKRSIANAAWRPREDHQGFFKDYSQVYRDRLARMRLDPAKLGFGGAAGEAWPELALRFTLSQPGVHTAIIGTTNPDNAARNIGFAQRGPLPEETTRAIRDAFTRAEKESGKTWTGQT